MMLPASPKSAPVKLTRRIPTTKTLSSAWGSGQYDTIVECRMTAAQQSFFAFLVT
jgi:hypothetical protein